MDHIFSWCDFQILVTLRATSRRLKGFAEKVLEQRALNDFPADLPADSETLLHPGWTVADHDALIERGLAQQFGEIDKDRARELLRSRGSVGSSDLLGVEEPGSFGWRVDINFDHSISTKCAWESSVWPNIMKILAVHGEEKAHDYSVRLQQALFSLLMAGARPASMQRATFQLKWDHDNINFLGCDVEFLMFLTSDNQPFEFRTATILTPSCPPLQNK
jgi:hypothetical protein